MNLSYIYVPVLLLQLSGADKVVSWNTHPPTTTNSRILRKIM